MSIFRKLVRRVSLILHPIDHGNFFVARAQDVLKPSTRGKLDYSVAHTYNVGFVLMASIYKSKRKDHFFSAAHVLTKGSQIHTQYVDLDCAKIQKDYIEGKLHRVSDSTFKSFLAGKQIDLSV